MPGIDIFNSDAFSTFELTDALERVEYAPTLLGSLGIFEARPVRTITVSVERRENKLALVQTSPRGAALPRRDTDKRDIRDFRTVRVAHGDTLRSDELQSIRAFGTTSELQQVQEEVMRRMIGVRRDVMLTLEHMRLGAIQGIVTDADGSTIINWFTQWGISQATEIDFDLDNATPASGAVRKKCNQVVRQMVKAAEGGWVDGQTQVYALCGDNFWDDLTSHEEVIATYTGWSAAADLRNDHGNPYGAFRYGGINWLNYRGTDDGTTVAINTNEAKFFPVGGNQVFQHAMSPGESFEWVNTPGREFYSLAIPDEKRNAYVDIEVYSYPLFLCTRPAMLQRAKRT